MCLTIWVYKLRLCLSHSPICTCIHIQYSGTVCIMVYYDVSREGIWDKSSFLYNHQNFSVSGRHELTHPRWWWSFHCQWHQVHPPEQHQTKSTLLFTLWCFSVLWLNPTKLFTVSQHKVHVTIKCHEGANKYPSIKENDPDAVIDVVSQLWTLALLQYILCITKSKLEYI